MLWDSEGNRLVSTIVLRSGHYGEEKNGAEFLDSGGGVRCVAHPCAQARNRQEPAFGEFLGRQHCSAYCGCLALAAE